MPVQRLTFWLYKPHTTPITPSLYLLNIIVISIKTTVFQ
nr:MAG TPA: hypothetical protein [Caudoviricetes sp.]